MTWRILKITPRQEKFVQASLTERKVCAFMPVETTWARHARRKARKTSVIFSGYLFLHDADDHAVAVALSIAGVRGFMVNAGEFIEISDREKTMLDLVWCSVFGLFDHTYDPPVKWSKGKRVKIKEGKLAGAVGEIIKVKAKDRMQVLIGAFGSKVDMTTDNLDEVPDDPPQTQPIAAKLAA